VSEEYLTEAEVAAMLTVPAETVRYWRWAGTGPRAFKVGRRVLYARADFDALVGERREAAGTRPRQTGAAPWRRRRQQR
jgi:Helix-turn-helix domain